MSKETQLPTRDRIAKGKKKKKNRINLHSKPQKNTRPNKNAFQKQQKSFRREAYNKSKAAGSHLIPLRALKPAIAAFFTTVTQISAAQKGMEQLTIPSKEKDPESDPKSKQDGERNLVRE